MKKVFVFCIGGTGLRVMKSIIMLMASGIDTNGYKVVPILVDPHNDLEEKKNLQSLVEKYTDIFNKTRNNGQEILNPLNGFFPSELSWINKLDSTSNDVNENIGVDKSFGPWLGLNKLTNNDTNNYLVDILFSTKNREDKLSVGFKGNPNVGTVVLDNLIEGASWFNSFKRHCEKDDRVFIISSIFGGTGASGFPLIEKKVREANDIPTVKNATMGAILVMPYYGLKDPITSHSDIDSSNFYTKTKAALSYYDSGKINSDYIYYIGETQLRKVYENNEKEQKDTANFIELVAASSLFDFLKRDKPQTTQYLSRAIENNQESMDKRSLGDGYNNIVKAVADFNLLIKLVSILKNERYFPLKKDRGFNESFYNDSACKSLYDFIDIYNQWYNELATNNRAFAPLNVNIDNRDLSRFVKGLTLQSKNDSFYLLQMIKESNKETDKHNNTFRYFLEFAYKSINYYTQKILE